jgi:diaminohydroxyphosphoribosylaminopyrimidine deaminase / 5-amino-6-(5-phosphoribosylamino)uracil reductase
LSHSSHQAVEKYLSVALDLAQLALTSSNPNPRVGCVITSAQGDVLGQGHTQQAGGAHAEIMALRDANLRGHSVQGAVAYVTLEPCSHQGRTGPCCDALAAAGIQKVVTCSTDPNPLVAGQGFTKLRAAGITVEVLDPTDPLAVRSRELNLGFFSRMVRKQPWVRMKIAASLDGKTALHNGSSQWITSEPARQDGHAWRARACAVLTGIGTVLQDKPRLDVRMVETPRQPHLVVIDSELQTPLDAPMWIPDREVLIYTCSSSDSKKEALQKRGATVIPMPSIHAQRTGTGEATRKVDLKAVILDLGQREINELHIEAGHKLNGALIEAGFVDEFLVYLAPKMLGQGKDMAAWGPLTELGRALPLRFTSTELQGPDLRIVARVTGRDNF